MSVVDQIAGYQAVANRTRSRSSHPAYSLKQRFAYPHHSQHQMLIEAFIAAEERHGELIKALQFGYANQQPNNTQWVKSIEDAQQQRGAAKELLDQAQTELEIYVNHSPEVRISLYQDEIKKLTSLLEEARQQQVSYTQTLLNDPTASERRLARQIDGDTSGSEYSPQQLAELRALKDDVRTIEAKIKSCEDDIGTIHRLVAEAEQRVKVQAAMSEAIPAFNSACVEFLRAWKELRNIASEHEILFYDQMPEIPSGAIFYQQMNPHDKQSILNLTFK